jgi:hypothetical protein
LIDANYVLAATGTGVISMVVVGPLTPAPALAPGHPPSRPARIHIKPRISRLEGLLCTLSPAPCTLFLSPKKRMGKPPCGFSPILPIYRRSGFGYLITPC